MKETISVVIPAYNAEPFLAEAIESCLAQTRQPNQIIVIDDGSTDRTAEVARGFSDDVTLVCLERCGAGVARNAGLAAATGDYIAMLDADDRMTPDRLQLQIDLFDARPEIDIAYGHQLIFQDGEDPVEQHQQGTGRVLTPCVTGTVTCRRSVFDDVGPFSEDPETIEVLDWFARAEDKGILSVSVEQIVLYRRQHASNWSTLNRLKYVHMLKTVLDRRRAQ
ncbi:glycosyltransferase family 2 protein [Rhodopirellula sp. P2]|uniref:glycosyltransferase family 2 protein n=1 Tax=Rhodopirellula sp. P2 TaxID=2127060 RepID=UPI002368C328|nr:glycosyltransferase family A protein [Rhodopirellula sp. P2]WDQ17792.1 glycosyltransferase family A protein [Rhodopirellula sp. P2]